MRRSPAGAGRQEAGDTPVLGVDPGTVVAGWGVVRGAGSKLLYSASGTISLRGSRPLRLAELHEAVAEICRRWSPAVVAIEKTFVGENVQSAFRLGEARGVVMLAAAQAGIEVAEYSPAEIKVAVTGSGRAAKDQVQRMVSRVLDLSQRLRTDEADALAVAICHVHSQVHTGLSGHRRSGGSRWSEADLRRISGAG